MVSKEEEKKRKKIGIVFTTVFHVLLILLLCAYQMDKIDPKPGVIEIGWELEGMEDSELASKIQNTDIAPPVENITPPKTSEDETKTITDDLSAISINEDKKPKKEKVKPSKEKLEDNKPPKDKKPAVSSWLKSLPSGGGTPSNGNPSSGPGSSLNPGPGAGSDGELNGPLGSGGTGNQWVIDDRKPVNLNLKHNNCNKTGIVKVYIKINRAGNVIYAADRGGTSQDPCLIRIALKQAKSIEYEPSNTVNEGTIEIDLGL
jgi:hypothetical protein